MLSNLFSKFIEGIVDEKLGAVDKAVVGLFASDVGKDETVWWRPVPRVVVELRLMDLDDGFDGQKNHDEDVILREW